LRVPVERPLAVERLEVERALVERLEVERLAVFFDDELRVERLPPLLEVVLLLLELLRFLSATFLLLL
jgi:hypothetical protein